MAKRYFEFKDAKSHKFWEVSVSAKKVNIRYGKVGTDGQTSVKELGTPAEAKAHAEKQAAGKVKKGYKEAKAKAKAVKKATKKAVKKKVAKKAVKKTAKKAVKKAVKKVVKKKTAKKAAKKTVEKTPAKGKGDKVDKEARKAVLKAVKEDGMALLKADKIFKADHEIVLAAVREKGHVLDYAAKSLKENREIVLAAVKQNGYALQFADKSMQADRKVVLAAIKQNSIALQYAHKNLKADREFVLMAVNEDDSLLEIDWVAKITEKENQNIKPIKETKTIIKNAKEKVKTEVNKKPDSSIKEIIAFYTGSITDYDETTYFPDGFNDKEEGGIPAILELTGVHAGWSVSFTEEEKIHNFKNVLKILTQKTFQSIVDYNIEVDDYDNDGEMLWVNGEVEILNNKISIKNATEKTSDYWGKIGERDTYEVVVKSNCPPYKVIVLFGNGEEKEYENIKDKGLKKVLQGLA